MIRIIVALLVAAAPAAAQNPSLSFDSGKSLPIATGQWTYVASATGSEARYGTHFAIRCDRTTRTVSIYRPNLPDSSLTIATSALTRALPVGGRLIADDPLLDSIAFSRGRFLVSGGSAPILAVPSWPETARSIEDCRN
jgi:hypothetical protein